MRAYSGMLLLEFNDHTYATPDGKSSINAYASVHCMADGSMADAEITCNMEML